MSNLMIRNNAALLCAQNAVFLLFTNKHHLYRLLQVLLGNCMPAVLNCQDGCFINHICKVRTNSTGCGKGNGLEINGIVKTHVLGVNLQNINTAFQIRTVNDHTAVKTAWTKKCRVQNLRTVGCSQDQKTLGSIKSIHLCKQLVQSLLTLIIPAAVMRITAFTDGINLVNKHNTRSILLGFLEKITDTGCTYTYEHLHKFRS